jgi:serpin B
MPEDENVMVSSSSIAAVIRMLAYGATGETQQEMLQLIGAAAASAADQENALKVLTSLAHPLDPKKPEPDVSIANGLFLRTTFVPKQEYVGAMQKAAEAEIVTLDFSDPNAVKTINGWVRDHTRAMIPSILDRISNTTVMIVINAVAFEGKWARQFDPENTKPRAFHRSDGTSVETPMMHREGEYAVAFLPQATIVEMPYEGGRYSMILLLPPQGASPKKLLEGLTTAKLDAWLAEAGSREISLTVPKWTATFERNLNKDLEALQMKRPFDPDRAEFDGIAEQTERLFVERILHKTFVEVSEKGTKAAAVTSGEVGATSVPEPPQEVVFDRPFAYLIRERNSGVVLFAGWLQRP